MIDRVVARSRAPPLRGAGRLQVVRAGAVRRLLLLRRRGERRRELPAPRRQRLDDRQGRPDPEPARGRDHCAHGSRAGRALPRARREVRRALLHAASTRRRRPSRRRGSPRLSPDAVAASTLAGEPITARLTRAPGNDAPIGGLKVVDRERLVRGATVRHREHLQDLRGELPRAALTSMPSCARRRRS